MIRLFKKLKNHPILINFDFKKAQNYELESSKVFIKDNFERIWLNLEKNKIAEIGSFPKCNNEFFSKNKKLWKTFVKQTTNKLNLEVGSGPFGHISSWTWVKKGVIIDPLINDYKKFQILNFGKSIFPKHLKLINASAEDFVPFLKNKIQGFILIRNTLDHTEDPIKIMENIAQYAMKGCYLLLWTDLWHLNGLDEGHRNITKSKKGFKSLIEGLNFQILHEIKPVRNDKSTIEFGCVAIKL